jgi:hypothetical protein
VTEASWDCDVRIAGHRGRCGAAANDVVSNQEIYDPRRCAISRRNQGVESVGREQSDGRRGSNQQPREFSPHRTP